MDRNQILKKLRESRGMTQAEAAEAMHVSRSHYVKLERGERGLTGHTIELAARAFGVDPGFIVSEIPFKQPEDIFSQLNRQDLDRVVSNVKILKSRLEPIPVVGRVEAGTFREVDDIADLAHDPEYVFDEPDPDFPQAKRVAFLVQGDSMNAAVPPLLEGYRVVCVDFEDAGIPLSDGMTVVVQRTRDGGLIREWSVKEVEMREDEIAFVPRSTNPRHKPIVVPLDPDPEDAVKVEVIAIARSVNAAIPRYRTPTK